MAGNTRFAVAIHILAVLGYLKREGVELVSSDLIAKSVNTNPVVVRTLLRSLKKAGLIHAREGKGGGVQLARSARSITLQQIYTAIEPDPVLTPNDKTPFFSCPVSRGMRRVFGTVANEVDAAVVKTLRGKTLQTVLDRL